jgi:succinate dehydrogenase/fumarate reductase flavoprotein subunit
MTHVARSILDTGGAYAVINKVPPGFESHARLNHAVAFLFFDRHGLNPFKDRWPLQMLLEGHMRGVGGLAIADDTSTGVPGLFAAGDVTDRTRLVGAGMSGGGPAVAWCFASGEWAGEAASRHARERSAASASCVALHALGTCGLRPLRTGGSRLDTTLVRDGVRAEVLPLEKHFFRTGAGMQASQGILDALWTQSRAALGGTDARSVLAAREAAALLASARWMLASAQQRTESRGLHRHGDYPQQDARQSHHLLSGGLDDVWVRQRALPGSTSGPVNASRSDRVEFA